MKNSIRNISNSKQVILKPMLTEGFPVLDVLSAPVIIVDSDGLVIFINQEATKYSSLTQPPFNVGFSLLDVICDPWKQIAANTLSAVLSTQVPQTLDISFKGLKGLTVHLEICCTRLASTSPQQPDLIVIEAKDNSMRKIFETKVISITNDLSNVIENANAVMIGVDSGGYITEWNEAAARVTGYDKEESYTLKIADLLLQGNADERFQAATQLVLKGQVVTNYELEICAKDKKNLTLLLNATPRKNVMGEVVGIFFVGQDITELITYRVSLENKVQERTAELRDAIEEQKKLVEMKNRFVSIASHEFRSPLSSINTHINFLNGKNDCSEEEKSARLESMQRHVNHMNMLLEDVLTIGRNESQKLTPTLSEIDIISFLRNLINEILIASATHTIKFNACDDKLFISGDESLLRNIFINLITNAIKFSPDSSEINVSVEAFDRTAKIIVEDYGIGIEASDMDRIFEPFNRGNNANEIPGTGLGLSIVKKAVAVLQGELCVESIYRKGTKFTIQLRLNSEA